MSVIYAGLRLDFGINVCYKTGMEKLRGVICMFYVRNSITDAGRYYSYRPQWVAAIIARLVQTPRRVTSEWFRCCFTWLAFLHVWAGLCCVRLGYGAIE
jgi:hypothetical protein